METPSSGSAGWPGPVSSADAPPDPADREALAYLAAVVVPALGDRASRGVRDALRRAIRDRRLDALERLTGRSRHELLVLIEQLSASRRRATPAVLVRLTTVISATPAAQDLVVVAAARPAR